MTKNNKDVKQLFLQKKPCSILLAISSHDRPNISELMKDAETTFSHTTNILSDFESCGLVKIESEGRMKRIELTKEGSDIARTLAALNGLLSGTGLLKDVERLDKKTASLESSISSGTLDNGRAEKKLEELTIKIDTIAKAAENFASPALNKAVADSREKIEALRPKISQT
jgi:predicted transcriptional regulator